MASHENIVDEEPPAINPYEVLGIDKKASDDEVKSAYRKAALKHHPDKVPERLKETAHTTFQSIAFAYAVLSDPKRRNRYDITGSTSVSIVDSDGFSWSDFYREQFDNVISDEAIEKFAKKYKGSDEERNDLLEAFGKCKGKMGQVYEMVMLSNPLEDEKRFRAIIDAAIESKVVDKYEAYTNESQASKDRRMKEAKDEADEAMQHAEDLGIKDKLFKKTGSKSKPAGEDVLMALIQQRQQAGASFLDKLEAKYGGKPQSKGKKGGKKGALEDEEDQGEPSEEAFQAAAARIAKRKADAENTSRPKRSKK